MQAEAPQTHPLGETENMEASHLVFSSSTTDAIRPVTPDGTDVAKICRPTA